MITRIFADRTADHPFVLDENVDGVNMLLRAKGGLVMDAVKLTTSKRGGLIKTKQVRDLCVRTGIAMTQEDSAGGDVSTAAIEHLAHFTLREFRITSSDDRLIAWEMPFDDMVYPNRDHSLRESDGTLVHVRMHILRYLQQHLPAGPRSETSN